MTVQGSSPYIIKNTWLYKAVYLIQLYNCCCHSIQLHLTLALTYPIFSGTFFAHCVPPCGEKSPSVHDLEVQLGKTRRPCDSSLPMVVMVNIYWWSSTIVANVFPISSGKYTDVRPMIRLQWLGSANFAAGCSLGTAKSTSHVSYQRFDRGLAGLGASAQAQRDLRWMTGWSDSNVAMSQYSPPILRGIGQQ